MWSNNKWAFYHAETTRSFLPFRNLRKLKCVFVCVTRRPCQKRAALSWAMLEELIWVRTPRRCVRYAAYGSQNISWPFAIVLVPKPTRQTCQISSYTSSTSSFRSHKTSTAGPPTAGTGIVPVQLSTKSLHESLMQSVLWNIYGTSSRCRENWAAFTSQMHFMLPSK